MKWYKSRFNNNKKFTYFTCQPALLITRYPNRQWVGLQLEVFKKDIHLTRYPLRKDGLGLR